MRVVRLSAPGGPEQLAIGEADRPRPGPAEALVRVHAAAITRNELEWPVDRLPAIPSYELSGVVEAVGAGAAGVAAGDEVFALTPFDRDGVAADYTTVGAELLVPKPAALGHAESAAIPLPALTAWQGLFDHGRLTAGERVLIHGAAGGVGSFAVQLARIAGARVIATASAGNLEPVRRLGADRVIDYRTEDFGILRDVDVVLDTVGGETQLRSFAVLRPGGVLASIVAPPDEALAKAHGIAASFLFHRTDAARLGLIAGLCDAGRLAVTVDRTLALVELHAALGHVATGQAHGKVLVRIDPGAFEADVFED